MLRNAPRQLTDRFDVSLLITPRPNDEELKTVPSWSGFDTSVSDVKSSFFSEASHALDIVCEKILAGPVWDSHQFLGSLEGKLQEYMNQQGGLFRSLLTQIHQQEAEVCVHGILGSFRDFIQQKRGLVPYFTPSYPMEQVVHTESELTKAKFPPSTLQLPSDILAEYKKKLIDEVQSSSESLLQTWNIKLGEINRKREEDERKKQAELFKKQELEKEKIRIQLTLEQDRLEKIKWAEFERHMAAARRHSELTQHFQPPYPSGNDLVSYQQWGNGKRTYYTWVKSGPFLYLNSISN